ncbi:hypothetical protein [Salinicola sp. NYA28a]
MKALLSPLAQLGRPPIADETAMKASARTDNPTTKVGETTLVPGRRLTIDECHA